MKTGIDLIKKPYKLNNEETSQILSVMTIFMEKAIGIAEKYVLYQKRDEITNIDIIKALKCQAMDYNNIWDNPEIKKQLHILYKDISYDLNNEIINCENNIINEDININKCDKNLNEDINKCDKKNLNEDKTNIDIIIKMDTINKRWLKWNPIDSESILLKEAIKKTENKYRLNI